MNLFFLFAFWLTPPRRHNALDRALPNPLLATTTGTPFRQSLQEKVRDDAAKLDFDWDKKQQAKNKNDEEAESRAPEQTAARRMRLRCFKQHTIRRRLR